MTQLSIIYKKTHFSLLPWIELCCAWLCLLQCFHRRLIIDCLLSAICREQSVMCNMQQCNAQNTSEYIGVGLQIMESRESKLSYSKNSSPTRKCFDWLSHREWRMDEWHWRCDQRKPTDAISNQSTANSLQWVLHCNDWKWQQCNLIRLWWCTSLKDCHRQNASKFEH